MSAVWVGPIPAGDPDDVTTIRDLVVQLIDWLRRVLGPTAEQYASTFPGADHTPAPSFRPSPVPRNTDTTPAPVAPEPDDDDQDNQRHDIPAIAQMPDPGPVPLRQHLTGCPGYPQCPGCGTPTCPRCSYHVDALPPLTICALCEHEVGVRPRCCPAFPICEHETDRDGRLIEQARQLGDEISGGHPVISTAARVLAAHTLLIDPDHCLCGWGTRQLAPELWHPDHVAQQLAIAGALHAPLALREPNRVTWAEIADLALLAHQAEAATDGDPYAEPDQVDLARAQHVMRTGRVWLVPLPAAATPAPAPKDHSC